MSTTLWGKFQYAKCFGHWVVSDPECSKCAIRDNCEKRTKTVAENQEVDLVEDKSEADTLKPIDPLQYLFQRLEGKFDRDPVEDKGKAVIHKFRIDGKTIVAVIIGKTSGKIKIMNIPEKKERVFGSLGDAEEVEQILKEIL